jgi:hypothetical protein
MDATTILMAAVEVARHNVDVVYQLGCLCK